MEGADHQSGKKLQHQTGGGAFGPPLPRPPNQKPPSRPNINISVPPPPPSSPTPYPQLCLKRLLHSPVSSSNSRSLSQPQFVSLDSLPPLNLNPPRFDSIPISTDVKLKSVMVENKPSVSLNREVHNTFQGGVSVALPPCKGHRRSKSDSPMGSSGYMQSSPSSGGGERLVWKPVQLALKAEANAGFQDDGGVVNGRKEAATATAADDDDLFSQYMSWENNDKMKFNGDKDLNSWTSGFKTLESNGNEVESRVDGKASGANGASSSFSKERGEGFKRSFNGDIAPVSRHRRSFSLDSSIGNSHVEDGLPKSSHLNSQVGKFSPSSSMDSIVMELEKAEFRAEEIKQIVKSDKLTAIALTDSKRARRILSNRQSAARSKEKKAQYVAELEQKVQTLQSERATLTTLVTKLQRDNSVLKNESKEYKLRLQATEQQSQLKENFGGESLANAITQQLALNQPMFPLQQHAMAQQLALNQPRFQLQQQQQPNQQQRHFVMQNLPAKDEWESRSEEIQGNEFHPMP